MEGEASSFESSEMLATFLRSTPLLWESWEVCGQANAKAAAAAAAAAAAGAGSGADESESLFVINRRGSATYVGFPSSVSDSGNNNLLEELEKAAPPPLFSALLLHPHQHQHPQIYHHPVMVHAGFLRLFLSILRLPSFQHQLFESIKASKSVVFTGHSIGGATASFSALWLLSYLQLNSNSNSSSSSSSTNINVMCITFGSPLLGNHSLSRAILRERWTGNFCHVVANRDVVPRLLFASPPPPLSFLQLPDDEKNKFFLLVLAACAQAAASAKQLGEKGEPNHNCFWPFGSYMLCSNKGAVCLDNDIAIVKLLHLMLARASSPTFSIEDHLSYHDYVDRMSNFHFLNNRGLMAEGDFTHSSYEAGVTLALQSLDISTTAGTCHDEAAAAKDCLRMAKRMGMGIGIGVRTPNLNSATLAIALSKISPLRAQIEWYKASCDESNDGMGYYDTFKQRGASRRHTKVNMNRIKLARFWDDIIHMLETNQLPLNFHKRAKWVNASHSYQLLVEPLDIAEYYRMGMHKKKGHYLKHGRERRHEIFDRWWRNRDVGEEEKNNMRSSFASLTQDSCFWARVEEAREWLEDFSQVEADTRKLSLLRDIDEFEEYARGIIERKEASRDVLAENSSYSLWINEWRQVKSQLSQRFPTQFPGFVF
ncbi:Carboxylesterase [Bertholletia excelsa]